MAHKTKVNGTAYDIVGGLTKVNGTDYDIIKGKTKVGGTDYDIEFDTNSFNWVGWDNATWQDIVALCKAKQDGVIDSFPSDVAVQNKKQLAMLKKPTQYYSTTGVYDAYLIRIKENSLVFFWNMPSLTWWGNFTGPKNKLTALQNTVGLTEIDSYMIPRPAHKAYYYSNKYLTFPSNRFFVPKVGEWDVSGSSSFSQMYSQEVYNDGVIGPRQSLTFPNTNSNITVGTLSGTTMSSYYYVIQSYFYSSTYPTTRSTSGSGSSSEWNLYPCFEVGGGS